MSDAKRNKEKYTDVPDIQSALNKIQSAPQIDLTRKKSLIFISCVVLAGGLSRLASFGLPLAAAATIPTKEEDSAGNDALISSHIPAYPEFSTSFSSISSIPKCDTTDSTAECVKKICDEVAKTLRPLNKPREGEKTIRPEDNKQLRSMIMDATQEKQKGTLAFWERFREGYGSKIETPILKEAALFFALRAGIIEISFLPNCGGAAARVFALLSTQSTLMGKGITVQGFGGVPKGTAGGAPGRIPGSPFNLINGHTFIRVKTPSDTLTCDPYNLRQLDRKPGPVGICTQEQVRKGKPPACAMFKDKNWAPDPPSSFEATFPDVSKLSPKARKFFHQEMEWQDNRYSEVMKAKSSYTL